ncbi:781_t:CDS:1 [Paraglomus brasilianum]|uniref:781_t:CDS:1 n=1 Tax=Paraglomus brasilianum TaxID=144538 RepID=A0A9N8WSN3_9GLOM|nr:781_t:CDS:1 [Paraglomus brasilianum]
MCSHDNRYCCSLLPNANLQITVPCESTVHTFAFPILSVSELASRCHKQVALNRFLVIRVSLQAFKEHLPRCVHKACTLYNPDRGNISKLAAKIWYYANKRVKKHLDKWREEVQKQIPVNINSFIREDGGNGRVRKVKKGEAATTDKTSGNEEKLEASEVSNIGNKESTTEITSDKNNVFINTTCNDELSTAMHAVPSHLPPSTPIVYQSVNSPPPYVQHAAYVRTTQMHHHDMSNPFVHTSLPSTSPIIYQEPFTCLSGFSALTHQPIQWNVNEETRESMGLPSVQDYNEMQIESGGFFHSTNGNFLAERRGTEEIRHNIGYNNTINNIIMGNVEGGMEREYFCINDSTKGQYL